MANVISLDQKLQLTKTQKGALIKMHKVAAIRKVFQCTHCVLKCEKCGTQITEQASAEMDARAHRIPYRFCESCMEEYGDYIRRLQGKGNPDCYWHNEQWLKLWRSWIDYQSAVDQYLKSKEFIVLLNALKQENPHD